MASQYQDVQCRNQACRNNGVTSRVWAHMAGPHLYDWPQVTCNVCGGSPIVLTEDDVRPAGLPEGIKNLAQGQ